MQRSFVPSPCYTPGITIVTTLLLFVPCSRPPLLVICTCSCVASPKWDALIVLFAGALYQALVYSYPSTFGHVT